MPPRPSVILMVGPSFLDLSVLQVPACTGRACVFKKIIYLPELTTPVWLLAPQRAEMDAMVLPGTHPTFP